MVALCICDVTVRVRAATPVPGLVVSCNPNNVTLIQGNKGTAARSPLNPLARADVRVVF